MLLVPGTLTGHRGPAHCQGSTTHQPRKNCHKQAANLGGGEKSPGWGGGRAGFMGAPEEDRRELLPVWVAGRHGVGAGSSQESVGSAEDGEVLEER